MEEAKRPIWSRSLLVRLLTYSVGSSLFMAGLNGYYLWNVSIPLLSSPEMKLRAAASSAFVVFWMVFPAAAAILGTIHSVVMLIHYRQITSRGEKEEEMAADLPHDSSNHARP